jgi:uncharacterized membrane protein
MATTPASVDKHPLHPILVAFPIGLWMFSLVCDLMHQFGHDRMWSLMAWYAMVAGLLGALAAALPGVIDFFAITDPRAGRVALLHLAINTGLILLFGVNAWVRTLLPLLPPTSMVPLLLSVGGIAGLMVSGWLGAELVYVHRIGVAQNGVALRPIKRGKRAA